MKKTRILKVIKDELNSTKNISGYLLSIEVNGDLMSSHVEIQYEPVKLVINEELSRCLERSSSHLVGRIIHDLDQGSKIEFPLDIESYL